MEVVNKATAIKLFNTSMPQMRAFHMSWSAFFLCFFAWFGIAPLMAVVREEFALTKSQIGNTIIASVLVTVVARLVVGWCCDRFGPRLTYTWLLVLGSIPVMGIGFAHDHTSFLLFRLGIGVIGASFVITQYHTSVMFAPNVVGTANATTAGWGNLGGGVTQLVMPLMFSGFVLVGFADFWAWRLSMAVVGLICLVTGLAYYKFTQDLPEGNFKALRAAGKLPRKESVRGTFIESCKDYRVWALFLIYGACFGIELTINNIAVLYFMDYFGLGLVAAGAMAALFGAFNIFARTLGGFYSDRLGARWGLKSRVTWLGLVLLFEGFSLMLFSRMTTLIIAVTAMMVFSLFVKMAQGATYAIVPFINRRALGSVSGIVGAGGNFGAVAAGFLLKAEALSWPTALLLLGILVSVCAGLTVFVRFSEADERAASAHIDEQRNAMGAVVNVHQAA